MSPACPSGKRVYDTEQIAEDALIQTWIRNDYVKGQGPVAVYRCDDCGRFHLTSRGSMNPRLTKLNENGELKRQREAARWEERFKRK